MERFIPQSPDPFIREDSDMALAKFGHLNAIIDEINTSVGTSTYVALLSQSSTSAPAATVITNTLGETPVLSYNGVGDYNLTITGSKFIAGKTDVEIQAVAMNGGQFFHFQASVIDENNINILSFNQSHNPANNALGFVRFSVKVYS